MFNKEKIESLEKKYEKLLISSARLSDRVIELEEYLKITFIPAKETVVRDAINGYFLEGNYEVARYEPTKKTKEQVRKRWDKQVKKSNKKVITKKKK